MAPTLLKATNCAELAARGLSARAGPMRRIGAETAPLGAKTAAGDAAATDHPTAKCVTGSGRRNAENNARFRHGLPMMSDLGNV